VQGVEFLSRATHFEPGRRLAIETCAFGTERLWTLKSSGRESPLSPDGDQIPLHSQMTRWVNRS